VTDAPLAAVPRSSRLKGLAAFVAIVWMVAASFIAFEVVALLAVDVALSHPDALGDVMVSQATKTSTACNVGPGERAFGTVPDISPDIARAAAWTLGLRLGEDAVVRQTPAAPDEMRKRSAQAVERLADSLGAPRPAPFTARQIAVANTEFVEHVEGDGAGTAHHLAVAYSVDACRLYKLGSFWGYSGFARSSLPGERALHAVEIHHYARQLGLPDALWQPMVNRSPADGTVDSISDGTRKLTDGMTAYLMGKRQK